MFDYLNYYNIDNNRAFLNAGSRLRYSFTTLEEEYFNLYSSINFEAHQELMNLEDSECSPLRQLDVNFYNSLNNKIEHKETLLRISKESFLEEYNDFGSIEFKEKKFLNKLILKVQQKIAYLNNFQKNSKIVFYEMFNTTENVDNRESNTLSVDIESGTLTLPVKEDVKCKIKEVRILTGSNGLPGDPFTGENKLIYKMLEDTNSIFQYSKLDSGPLKLVLEFILTEEKVLNEFLLKRNSQFNDCNILIEDIVFKNLNEEKVHLRTLINKTKQRLSCDTYRLEDGIKIKHLPVKAKKIELHLICEDYDVSNGRKIFSIDIKNVEFHSKKYKEKGKIYFKEQNISEEVSAFSASIEDVVYPGSQDDSKNIIKKIKFDNEGYIDCSNSSLILNEEKSSYAIYYEVERKDFVEKLSVEETQYRSVETESERKVFSKNFNPNEYNINPKLNGLKVFQPSIYKRTRETRNNTFLAMIAGNRVLNKLLLPLNLNELGINSSEANVYINEYLCTQYQTYSDFEAGQGNKIFFHEDGDYLFVSTDLNLNLLKCTINFLPKTHSIEVLGERLHISINENFDPTKSNVMLRQIKRRPSFYTNKFDLNNNKVVINKENILQESVTVFDVDGTDITSDCLITVNERSLVIKNFNEIVTIFVEFEYREVIEIENFNFWVNQKNEYPGITIDKDEVEPGSLTETLDEGNDYLNLSNANLLKRSLIIDDEGFGYKELEEVDFFNGRHELLNLGHVEKEMLPIIVARNNSVTTTMTREPCLDGLVVKIKKDDNYINARYEMLDERIIKIFIDDEDTKGYSLEYFYKKRKEPNKVYYSVDYASGKVYFSERAMQDCSIKYSWLDLEVSYEIVKDCSSFKANGSSLKVDINNLTDVNQNLKFVWYADAETFSIEGIEEYYSPIVYEIKMEMA